MSTSHPRFRLRIAITAILAAVLALNAAATLYAAVTAPTVRACVKASGPDKGLMRYLPSGKCAAGEKSLEWHVTGPAGATGPQGPAGSATGAGPTPYWVSDWHPEPVFAGGSAATSLAVPAGTYLVGLQLSLMADTSTIPEIPTPTDLLVMTVHCTLTAGSETRTLSGSLYEGWSSSLASQVVATMTAGGKVAVSCSQTTSGVIGRAPFLRLAIDGLLTATPITVQ